MSLSDNREALAPHRQPATMSTPNVSFSQLAQQFQFPKKEQAIITDSIDGVQIKDYVLAIGKIIGPQNIRFASRISQGRVCLYLSSQEIADNLTSTNTKINIGSHSLLFRPLISKTKRIIISNVCPIIPHSTIENALIAHKVQPTSPITFLRAGMNEPGYSHIMSFRRQMYVNPEDVSKIPENLQINYDGTVYWIYFTSEKLMCFLCKEDGHIAKHCKNETLLSQSSCEIQQSNENTVPSVEGDSSSPDLRNISSASQLLTSPDINSMPPPAIRSSYTKQIGGGTKRPLSESSSSNNSTYINNPEKKPPQSRRKNTTQAKKQCTITEIDEHLIKSKEFLEQNAQTYPISYDQFKDFLQVSYGNNNLVDTAKEYTANLKGLVLMLEDAYLHSDNRTLKARITRIKKKILNPNNTNSTSEESNDEKEI